MQGEPDFITNLKQKAPAMVQTVTTLSEQDHSQGAIGLTSSIDRMKNADWLRATHGGTYKKIKNLPWIKDGLTADEAKTAQDLLYMSVNDHETLKRTLTLQWIEDQITPSEAKAIRWLMYLSSRNDKAARKIAKMPFLESVTEKDALLIAGLHARSHRGTLAGFMRHPTVADDITDEETLFAVAATTIDQEAHLSRILNRENATAETIQTTSSRTPELNISIIRAGTRNTTNSSELIEDAIKHVEDEMNLPLPTNHVIVLLDDTGVITGFAGVNYGQAIAYLKKGEDGSTWDRAAFRAAMVHEVAHYFWRGNEDWIDEGMANTIERNFGMNQGLPSDLTSTDQGSCTLKTLQELSNQQPENQSSQFQCNYYLGEKIFLELQQSTGEQEFKERARKLYEISLMLNKENQKAGIEEVRKTFGEADSIITKHWTGKTPDSILVKEISPNPTKPSLSSPTIEPRQPTPHLLKVSTLAAAPTNIPNLTGNGTPTPMPRNIFQITPVEIQPRPTRTKPPLKLVPTGPTPTPTPTPEPTPVLPTPYRDNDLSHGYTITIPPSWRTVQQGSETVFQSPDETGQIRVSVREFSKEMDERQFAKQIRQKAIDTHAHKDDHFDIYAWEEQFNKGAQWQQKFTWTLWSAEDSCVQTRTDVIFRSRHFPSRPKAYILTLSACSERFTQHVADWENSLESFTEVIPKT